MYINSLFRKINLQPQKLHLGSKQIRFTTSDKKDVEGKLSVLSDKGILDKGIPTNCIFPYY